MSLTVSSEILICVCICVSMLFLAIPHYVFHISYKVEIDCGSVLCDYFAERNSICFWQITRTSRNARLGSSNQELK